jgi:hypothetical protein
MIDREFLKEAREAAQNPLTTLSELFCCLANLLDQVRVSLDGQCGYELLNDATATIALLRVAIDLKYTKVESLETRHQLLVAEVRELQTKVRTLEEAAKPALTPASAAPAFDAKPTRPEKKLSAPTRKPSLEIIDDEPEND